jgi:multidrug efflux pump subunit AcrA (membrane-fusion protein)
MKRYNIAALLAALILVLASCASESESSITLADAVEVKYDTAAAVRGDLAQREQYEAYVKAAVESIAFEGRSGAFKKFYVTLGETVKKGDPIAEMDMSAVEEQIAKSRDDIEYKKKKLDYDLEQKQYDIDSAQLDSLKKTVATAVGIDPARGDAIEVQPMKFNAPDTTAQEKDAKKQAWMSQLTTVGKYAGGAVLLLVEPEQVGVVDFSVRTQADREYEAVR